MRMLLRAVPYIIKADDVEWTLKGMFRGVTEVVGPDQGLSPTLALQERRPHSLTAATLNSNWTRVAVS